MADEAKSKDYTGRGITFGVVFGFAVYFITFNTARPMPAFGWALLTAGCFALAGAFLDYLEGR